MSAMTPAEWLLLRADWLVYHLDGTYAQLGDAQRAVAAHREEIEAMVRGIRGESDAA